MQNLYNLAEKIPNNNKNEQDDLQNQVVNVQVDKQNKNEQYLKQNYNNENTQQNLVENYRNLIDQRKKKYLLNLKCQTIFNFKEQIAGLLQLEKSIIAVLENDSDTIHILNAIPQNKQQQNQQQNQIMGDDIYQKQLKSQNSMFQIIKIKNQFFDYPLIAGASYKNIEIFDWKKGVTLSIIQPQQKIIQYIEEIQNSYIASGGSDLSIKVIEFKKIKCWNNNDEQVLNNNYDIKQKNQFNLFLYKTLNEHKHGVNMIKKINKKLFLTDDGPRPFHNRLLLWNTKKLQILRIFLHPSRVSALMGCKNKDYYLMSYNDNIRYISLSKNVIIKKLDVDIVYQMTQTDNFEQFIVVGGGAIFQPFKGSMIIIDQQNGEILKRYDKELEGICNKIVQIGENMFVTANLQEQNSFNIKLWSPYF
ncbi:WD40-repeat-containing domain [Pseudocohnilembus persalinus]|uniref:WD40-repeat-containing domain n=1 Tax=Pseudocohnilembus persalinus TaxID=266149 RepID=A0A0V0QAG5_PSEPJ|nr:WD40-repeat-containing domain [Pseudocohnilembus persalinus]|eukprot:KRW99214.1 WD40-repeat-containing domain [Pseudocohnilembus persalinus]